VTPLVRVRIDGVPTARAVLVDTEPKAVNAALRSPGGRLIDPSRCVTGHSGCANNWAFGYLVQQSSREYEQSSRRVTIFEQAMEAIRQEVECCSGMVEFLMIHSTAGGSGSGLGSLILENLRAQYPLAYIVAASVIPNLGGDTPVQSLNVCLTLQWLQAYADGVMLFRNDQLLVSLSSNETGTKTGGGGGGGVSAPSLSLEVVNRYIARCLAGLLLPGVVEVDRLGNRRTACHLPLKQLVMQVCPSPEMKFFEVYHSHASPAAASKGGSAAWQSAVRQLGSLAPRFDSLDGNRPVLATGSRMVARGGPQGSSSGANPASEVEKAMGRSGVLSAVGWCEGALSVVTARTCPSWLAATSEAPGGSKGGSALGEAAAVSGAEPTCLTVATNRSTVVGLFRQLSGRAVQLCDAGAYMHWYERHGCSTAAITDAAQRVQDLADCYAQWYGFHVPQ